jgi:hypothetical protein
MKKVYLKTFLLVHVVRDFSLTDCPPACWVTLAFLPDEPCPTVPFTHFVCLGDITTVSHPLLSSPRVPGKKRVFPVFLRFFPLSFLVREDPILLSSVDVYCCTYRKDVGNTLPLCETIGISILKVFQTKTLDNPSSRSSSGFGTRSLVSYTQCLLVITPDLSRGGFTPKGGIDSVRTWLRDFFIVD